MGWAHELAATPTRIKDLSDDKARGIYREAQKIDEWAGEAYEGTSVLAGAKVVQRSGYMEQYRWCFGLADVLLALAYEGPVVLGLPWYESMYEPRDGWIKVEGSPVGGHCILATSVRLTSESIKLHNSWGPDWGVKGMALLSFGDLEKLLHHGGEACVPVNRRKPKWA
jgi:hypothetical protein